MTPAAALLVPYRHPHGGSGIPRTEPVPAGWRFRDAPPDVVAHALALGDAAPGPPGPDGRPPPDWLVRTADRLDGRLSGFVPERDAALLRVDGITVRRARRHDLVRCVADAWPDGEEGSPGALRSALGEVHPGWEAVEATWKGPGRALTGRISRGEVVGLWWE